MCVLSQLIVGPPLPSKPCVCPSDWFFKSFPPSKCPLLSEIIDIFDCIFCESHCDDGASLSGSVSCRRRPKLCRSSPFIRWAAAEIDTDDLERPLTSSTIFVAHPRPLLLRPLAFYSLANHAQLASQSMITRNGRVSIARPLLHEGDTERIHLFDLFFQRKVECPKKLIGCWRFDVRVICQVWATLTDLGAVS